MRWFENKVSMCLACVMVFRIANLNLPDRPETEVNVLERIDGHDLQMLKDKSEIRFPFWVKKQTPLLCKRKSGHTPYVCCIF